MRCHPQGSALKVGITSDAPIHLRGEAGILPTPLGDTLTNVGLVQVDKDAIEIAASDVLDLLSGRPVVEAAMGMILAAITAFNQDRLPPETEDTILAEVAAHITTILAGQNETVN